jgi:hypothetical protein
MIHKALNSIEWNIIVLQNDKNAKNKILQMGFGMPDVLKIRQVNS